MSTGSSDDGFNWSIDTWDVLDSYFAQNKILAEHQIASYDNLIDYVIPQIIERNNPIQVVSGYTSNDKFTGFKMKYEITFLQTYLSKPLIQENNDVIKPLYPNEARLRGLTYAAPMFVDVRHTLTIVDDEGKPVNKPQTAVESKIPFFKIPVMLHSKYCHLSDRSETSLKEMGECEYDQGGYFIVNGGEKVLIAQERMAENQVFVWSKSSNNRYSQEAEVKSSIDQRFYPVKVNKVMLTKEPSDKAVEAALKDPSKGSAGRTIRLKMPQVKDEIPLFIAFRALGVITEQEACEMIVPDHATMDSNYMNFLWFSIEEARAKGVMTQQSALEYISRSLNMTFNEDFRKQSKDIHLKYVKDILNRELFPHIGQTARKKAFFLGHMTRRLMDAYFGVRPYDDRDHYGNKRVDLSGPLLNALFRHNLINLVKVLKQQILPKLTNDTGGLVNSLRKIIQGCGIESKLKYGLATGNWSTQKSSISASKKGIAQVLNRLSAIGALSHTRRVQSPLERSGSKIVAPRRLHSTHYGMCCPNETPEGGQVGIVKNFSMQTHITIQTSDYPIRMALSELGVKNMNETIPTEVATSVKIFVNGDWYGVISEYLAKKLYDQLKTLKRHGIIVPYISIAWNIDWKEIIIQTDGGRYSRPLYIVENNKLLISNLYRDNEEFRTKFRSKDFKWMSLLGGFSNTSGPLNISNGAVIEYLDTNELENAMVAMTIADLKANSKLNNYYMHYSHHEIHPMMMMGVTATMIPYSDHNQSPRNCYQCLWIEEDVIMADGSRKKIKDIQIGDSVITVNPQTLKRTTSKVVHQYVKPTTKTMYILETVTGRRVVATHDHPILTYEGWRQVETLTSESLISVCPEVQFYPMQGQALILDQFSFLGSDRQSLQKANLLPLFEYNPKLVVLARICGYLWNSSISGETITCTFQDEPSRDDFLSDIQQLSLDSQMTLVSDLSITLTGLLASYLNQLMSHLPGSYSLPHWIQNGCTLIQREFLAGFNGYATLISNPPVNDPQIHSLYQNFGVEFQDGELVKSISNMSLMFSTIGIQYNTQSYSVFLATLEFLKYQEQGGTMSIQTWYKTIKVIGKSIFVPIKPLKIHDNVMIADITIESETHSFITGQEICVHNSSMGKQAIGYYVTNYNQRMETLANVLVYGHKPLVATRTMKYVFINQLPHGETAMLLYACYAYNQEDSVCLNRDAIARGFFNSIYFRTYKDKEQKHKSATTATEKFMKPNKSNTRDLKHGSYNAVDDEGVPILGKVTNGGDIIIGKVIESKEPDALGMIYKDASTVVRANEHGTIDMVIPDPNLKIHNYNAEGHRFIAARVSNLRKPELGDKFASRYAQKGTCGMTFTQEDLPVTSFGLVPDIIINSHGIPSRMTANKLIETFLGKVALCTGEIQDATPFTPFDLKSFQKILKDYGCHDMGYEVMYNGEMGHMYEIQFFYGPTYYQRLKHMTADKYHARSSGPIQLLTRQPTEGRSRDGGLRAGEMEVQAMFGHGVTKFLKEKITDDSDLFQVFLSKKQESFIVGNPEKRIFKYNGTNLMDDEVSELQLPYAMLLLLNEIQSMGIDVRIQTN